MRKILTSVLSVAGLLAVVLALASSPASAAKEVVTIQTSGDPSQAGTYTVSWETQGGCDPGSGTSGASGSAEMTVADADGDGAETTGPQQETGVVTDNVCNYTWKATFTNAAGAACVVGGTGTTDTTAGTLTVADGTLALLVGTCASTGKLAVTVKAPGVNLGDCISAGTEDTPDESDDCDSDADGTDDPGTRPAAADDVTDSDSAGAASATTFTITATPQKAAANGKVPEGCNAVSEDTEADPGDNDLQKATLTVTDQALGGAECMYTVTAALPAGFAAGDGSARSTGNSQKDRDPAQNDGADGTAGNADDDTIAVPDLTVSIATTKVYLVQNVIGDAGGASAEYKYTAPCGAPGLPGALGQTPASGGITTVEGKTVVELRTGRFNVSAALPDGSADDGKEATALDGKGKACEATVSVSGVPAHCSVSHNSPASLASASDSVIIEVTVDCSEPVAPEPPADDGADMDDGDDMGADDTDDGDDMGADDTDDGDDMSAGDDMDMGPPEDTPTG